MKLRQTPILVHLLGAAAASALAAYWIMQLLLTPPTPVAPVAGSAIALRDPDPRLAARLFGDLNGGPVAIARNVQVSGVYAAGRASSAVIAIDGRPARVVLLNEEAAPGLRLVEVRGDGVTLESDGTRTSYAVPPLAIARATSAAPQFHREGNVLTAPMLEPGTSARPAPAGPGASRFSGAVAPGAPPGMLLPSRGVADDPAGRMGQQAPGQLQGSAPGG